MSRTHFLAKNCGEFSSRNSKYFKRRALSCVKKYVRGYAMFLEAAG